MYRQEEELRGLQGGRAGHRMYVKTIVPLILHACKTGARKALCRQRKIASLFEDIALTLVLSKMLVSFLFSFFSNDSASLLHETMDHFSFT